MISNQTSLDNLSATAARAAESSEVLGSMARNFLTSGDTSKALARVAMNRNTLLNDEVAKLFRSLGLVGNIAKHRSVGFDPSVSDILQTRLFPKTNLLPEFHLFSPGHVPASPAGLTVTPPAQAKRKRGRPPGSPDDGFVSQGLQMLLCGEADCGQHAARLVIKIHGFQPRGGPETGRVEGSTPTEAINRLARKIRYDFERWR